MKKKLTLAQLQKELARQEAVQAGHTQSLLHVQARVVRLEAALGRPWRMADGRLVVPGLMSDNHLRQALGLRGDVGDLQRELDRRDSDDAWHRKAGTISPRAVVAKLTKWLRWIL
jgi:hypothetical protein